MADCVMYRAAEVKRKKAEEEANALWPSVRADETYIVYEVYYVFQCNTNTHLFLTKPMGIEGS